MAHTSRPRSALSPVPLNHFLPHSSSLAQQTSCFVQLPVVACSPATMISQRVRAGLKRKKGARTRLASNSSAENAAKTRSTHKDQQDHPYATSPALGRSSSLARRRRNDAKLNIVTSPHLPRDKPSSSASELSEWSSVASVSPTSSRAPVLRSEDHLEPAQQRPGIQTRRSSRSSLHRTLDGMTLEDRRPNAADRSSRSLSASMSRQSSSRTAGSADNAPPQPRQRRVASSTAVLDSDHSSDGPDDMDDEEAEHVRLVESAPTWQLHRLRRDELIQLSQIAGAWDTDPTDDQLELLTKHDLVNQIITSRSRLDRSQTGKERNFAAVQRQRPSRQASHRFSRHDGGDNEKFLADSHPTSHRSQSTLHSASPDDSDDSSDSDASNEAGGEETEAEPSRMRIPRRHMPRYRQGRIEADNALRRMDSATFDEMEPSKANQAPRRQLRNKTDVRRANSRRLGSDLLSASASSSIFGGRSSRASQNSHSPFVHRYKPNVFVASSPVRTRSRTARMTLGMPSRRKKASRGLEAADGGAAAFDPMATPKLGGRRPRCGQKAVQFHISPSVTIGEQQDDEWMEGDSTDSEAVDASLQTEPSPVEDPNASSRALGIQRGTRKASRTRRSTAGSESSLTSHQPRSRSVSMEPPSEPDVEQVHSDADMATSDDDAPTPTKFRKLRNGKLRLVSGSAVGGTDAKDPESERMDDVDMESAPETTTAPARARSARTESPEDEAPQNGDSEDCENAMVEPSFAALSRLRKAALEQLCNHREIDIGADDKKANLITKLLEWHQLTALEAAGEDGSGSDDEGSSLRPNASTETIVGGADAIRSNVSTATATADDEAAKAGQRTPTRRRNGRAGRHARPAATDSDKPLLLRGRDKGNTSSDKLPTPPLTSNNEEAQAPQAGDGVDELNGLDLESLNLTDKEIAPSKLEKLEKIGSGGFKDVYVGKYRISKTRVNKVAIADIRDQLTEMDIKELSLLRDLRHENIVRFIGVSIPEDPRHVPCMIVSELCSNGDLFDYIRNVEAPCDAEVFRILLETARGLEYLHTRTPAIIHRDCKSTNVLITRRKTAKINDFGLARVKNTSRSMMRSLVGTVNWQAVELWVPKPHYNEKVDVWSAAMTFWEALQWHQPEKKYPFQGMNEHQIYQDVGQKKQRPYTGAIRRQFGGEIVDLLDRMWDHAPKNRPSMTEVCTELEALIQMKKDAAAAASHPSKV
ncbi:kinase-like protein [Moesziomyces antarcticus]|uniref:Kinase-like protein n=2 Tax=Pseudozyma antarctica TaxID=84753 RepID=A0A081CGY1_PSEA2|nr:kinase-like protein [Moesziomyces antarcticus]GAK65927.1 kinase-like protein [Moesziomyces antarcticus]